MGEAGTRIRSVGLWLLVAAFLILLVVFVARRSGGFSDPVTFGGEIALTESGGAEVPAERSLSIVTVLPKDRIRAVFEPSFVTAEEAGAYFVGSDLVIGVSINGDHRAYGTGFISTREVVNDTVGGQPIAVTW